MTRHYCRPNLPEGDPFPVAGGSCLHKMDQNESPYDLPDSLKKELCDRLQSSNWSCYPQPQIYKDVKKKLGGSFGLDAEQFALTQGCDGAIQGIHFVAGGFGRKALVIQPTYPMLHHAAWLAGTHVNNCTAGPDYRLDPDWFPGHDLILLANPNNPTGTLTPEKTILHALNSQAMLFVDEAYFDFSGVTMIDHLNEHSNLTIGRSFSKAMLAGLRLGLLIGPPTVIRKYEALVTAPYHLSISQLVIASNYDRILPHVQRMSRHVVIERDRMSSLLHDAGICHYPSSANFILMKIENAESVYQSLLRQGVRIRNMAKIPGLESHLRVTVGSPEDNQAFLKALMESLSDVTS